MMSEKEDSHKFTWVYMFTTALKWKSDITAVSGYWWQKKKEVILILRYFLFSLTKKRSLFLKKLVSKFCFYMTTNCIYKNTILRFTRKLWYLNYHTSHTSFLTHLTEMTASEAVNIFALREGICLILRSRKKHPASFLTHSLQVFQI